MGDSGEGRQIDGGGKVDHKLLRGKPLEVYNVDNSMEQSGGYVRELRTH